MNEITQGENSAPLVRLNKSPPIFRALTVKSENTSELSSHLVIRQWKVINLQRGSKRTGERERESRETLINGAYKALPPPYPLLLRPWTTVIHGCVAEGRALRFFRGRARCFNHPKFFSHRVTTHARTREFCALSTGVLVRKNQRPDEYSFPVPEDMGRRRRGNRRDRRSGGGTYVSDQHFCCFTFRSAVDRLGDAVSELGLGC